MVRLRVTSANKRDAVRTRALHSTPAMEYKLWALLLLIVDRGGLRKPRPGTRGFVLDAGAHDGATAVMLVNAMRHLRLSVLALEPLLDDLHVEQPEEAAAEAEAQRVGGLGVEGEGGVRQREGL